MKTLRIPDRAASALIVALALLLGACAPAKPTSTQSPAPPSETPAGAEPVAPAPAAEPAAPVKTETKAAAEPAAPPARAMVAAANPLAAQAGRDILAAGGSAVDAAIAAQMILNLVEPQSSGIGGGAFLMHFDAGTGAIDAYDGRETAPESATPNMFLQGDGSPKGFYEAAVSGLSVGVPGVLRMLEKAHREHGRLPWAALFRPAIEMARQGFLVSPRLAESVAKDDYLSLIPDTAPYFLPDDRPLRAGQRLKNPEFAAVLEEIAEGGADAFYRGKTARAIVAAVGTAPTVGAEMTLDDIAGYEAKKRDPVCLPYRVWLVCGMGPPTSGGVAVLQILGILQNFDLGSMKPFSAEAVHLITEASRLAFADRAVYLADPDFIPVPVAGLIDPAYLAARAQEISPDRSMGEAFPGMPGIAALPRFAPDDAPKGLSTTHLSVVDGVGNAVSMTSSIENRFGSRLMARGFLLNNQLTDFSFQPIKNGAPVANRVEPGKRPRSSMSPTLVFGPDGDLLLAVGSPGGSRIIAYVVKALVATLDWKMPVDAALDAPNFANRNGPTDIEKGTALEDIVAALEAMGHEVRVRDMTSGLHAIMRVDGGLAGGADRRREGVAVGLP